MASSRQLWMVWVVSGIAVGLLVMALRYPWPGSRPRAPKSSAKSAAGAESRRVSVVVVIRAKETPRPLPPVAVKPPEPTPKVAPVAVSPAKAIPRPVAAVAAVAPAPVPPLSPQPKPTPSPIVPRAPPMAATRPAVSPVPPPVVHQAAPSVVTPEERVELGRNLMGLDGAKSGTVPLISMDYRQNLGWPAYARAMTHLGGQFFIFDHRRERILASADLERGTLTPADAGALGGLSPRIREVRDEIAVEPLMRTAAARFGGDRLALILLVPLNLDFEIVGGVASQLQALGYAPGAVGRVEGIYERGDGRLRLRVQRIVLREGKAVPANFMVGL